MAPLEGVLVVDLTRSLPGPFASRELLELGAAPRRSHAGDGTRMARGAERRESTTRGGFAARRLGGEPIPELLAGGLACDAIYPPAHCRHLTVAALESKFFVRLDFAELENEDVCVGPVATLEEAAVEFGAETV